MVDVLCTLCTVYTMLSARDVRSPGIVGDLLPILSIAAAISKENCVGMPALHQTALSHPTKTGSVVTTSGAPL